MSDPRTIPDSALQRLGCVLADCLDDDHWNDIEANYLLPALEERVDLCERISDLESKHPEWMKRIQRERQEERERCAREAAGLMCKWLDEQFYHGNSGMFPTSSLFLDSF